MRIFRLIKNVELKQEKVGINNAHRIMETPFMTRRSIRNIKIQLAKKKTTAMAPPMKKSNAASGNRHKIVAREVRGKGPTTTSLEPNIKKRFLTSLMTFSIFRPTAITILLEMTQKVPI